MGMQFFEYRQPQPRNPFEQRHTPEQYDRTVDELAHRFIFDKDQLDSGDIEREIRPVMRMPSVASREKENHRLEALLLLLKGQAAHERANLYFGGAWQAALVRQHSRKPSERKDPAALTREDVAQEFDAFDFEAKIREAEQQALQAYTQALERTTEDVLARPSTNTTIDRTDVDVLMLDLRNRIAERIEDESVRRQELTSLDEELKQIIEGLTSEEDRGRRLELQEIYLMRCLIHAADTGHLASVRHGTPREDLRRDMGSVDIELTAAGDRLPFQVKTFMRRVSSYTLEEQHTIRAESLSRLRGSSTHFVVLETEDVRDAYNAALRRSARQPVSLADKYRAFKPLASDIQPEERAKLLQLIGLTEAELAKEQQEFEQKQSQRVAFETEMQGRRQAEEQRLAQEAALLQAKRESEERAEQERLTAIAKHEEEQRQASRREFEARTEKGMAKQREAEVRLAEATQREAARRAEEARLAAEAASKEARRKRRAEKEAAMPDWPPKSVVGLSNPVLFQQLGLLPEDWKNDVPSLLAAKKRFLKLFVKPKRGTTEPTEQDKPNDLFKQAFPSESSLTSPSPEDVKRWRELTQK